METSIKKTKAKSFTYSLHATKSPEEIFALLLDITNWWSGIYEETITGETAKINDEFSFRTSSGVHYSKHRLVELEPYTKIVWLVTESNLTFLEEPNEWVDTKICFDISREEEKTVVTFTHEGLVPQIECYSDCSMAWTAYLKKFEQLMNENR